MNIWLIFLAGKKPKLSFELRPLHLLPHFFCIGLQTHFSKKSILIFFNSSPILSEPIPVSFDSTLQILTYWQHLTVDDVGFPETLSPLGIRTAGSPDFLPTVGCSFSVSFVVPPHLPTSSCTGAQGTVLGWLLFLIYTHSLSMFRKFLCFNNAL